MMQIWVGLGNPGAKYALNRHNVGFMAMDAIAEVYGFGPEQKKFAGSVREGRIGTQKILLLKPATFMNESGRSVGEAMRFYKLDMDALTVFHDELDLAPGKVRVKRGGGHAGHNGLRSLHAHIGPDYRRVRIGIGHPGHKDRVSGYVLSDFAKAETGLLADVMRGISDGADALAAGDDGRFMTAVALRVAPPRASTGTARAVDPLTVFYRYGCCETGTEDRGSHTVFAVMTDEFLAFSKYLGNDLSTPRPEYQFPGLKAGDRWCLCASRFLQAHDEGVAPKVDLKATHSRALDVVPLEILQLYGVEESTG